MKLPVNIASPLYQGPQEEDPGDDLLSHAALHALGLEGLALAILGYNLKCELSGPVWGLQSVPNINPQNWIRPQRALKPGS